MINIKRKRYTYQDVKDIVERLNYELLSDKNEIVDKKGYVKTSEKVRVWCKNKNHPPSYAELGKIIKNRRCSKCVVDERRLTYENVKGYIESFNYVLVSDSYTSVHKKLTIKCPQNHTFNMTYANFQQGQRCPTCGVKVRSEKAKYDYDEVKSCLGSEGYELLSDEYINVKEKLKLKCPQGHIWEVTLDSFNSGSRCKHCYGNIKFDFEYVKEYIESFGYKLLSSTYLNCDSKLDLECPNGHKFRMSFYNFKNKNNRCSICSCSKGEDRICSILNRVKIRYKSQYKFKNCKFKNVLPFDFYLPNYNACIEYDGEQHFRPVERFGGLEGFIDTKIRDTIKNVYCKNNDITLIRIPYWEFDNIENILKANLKI